MISYRFIFCALLFLWSTASSTNAEPGVPIKRFEEGQLPAAATLAEFSWLQGHWKGNFFDGGTVEHLLPNPVHNQLPGLVRFYKDSIWGNEISVFIQRNGTVDYVVRHFHSGLIAVEPVDQPIVRSLIAIEGNRYYFDGITFVNEGPNRHTVYFEVPDGERKGELLIVDMRKQGQSLQ